MFCILNEIWVIFSKSGFRLHMACICKKRFRESLRNLYSFLLVVTLFCWFVEIRSFYIAQAGLKAHNLPTLASGVLELRRYAITLSSWPILIIPKVFLLLLLLLEQVLLCSPGRPGTWCVDETGHIQVDLLISASWVRATMLAGKISVMVQSGHTRFPLSNDPSGSSLWPQPFLSHHRSSLNCGNH